MFLPISSAQNTNNQQNQIGKDARMQDNAKEEIQSLLDEKAKRTFAQKKMDSQLIYAIKRKRGQPISDKVQALETRVEIKESGLTLVDIKANVTKALLAKITSLGGAVIYSSEQAKSVRASVPFDKIETLAARADVQFIGPAADFTTERPGTLNSNPTPRDKINTPKKDHNDDLNLRPPQGALKPNGATGQVVSEGDATHRAREARDVFSATGSNLKIGVLSDGVDSLSSLQAQGELPYDVTVITDSNGNDQSGSGSEGTAMMEIIYDLAPGAKLYFATANNSPASFAENIRTLRRLGCDIIVDDVAYYNESPFQDDIISLAVNYVTTDGGLYFSSSGNEWNSDQYFSGVWEGDFSDGGSTADFLRPGTNPTPVIGEAGRLHDFNAGPGVQIQNPIGKPFSNFTTPATLFWADPLGQSANDYDLFLVDASGAVVASSTNIQNGSQDPYEAFYIPATPLTTGAQRIVIVKKPSAAARFLHISLNRDVFATGSSGLSAFSTTGQIKGHTAAADAYSVAASPAYTKYCSFCSPGPYPNSFNPSNLTEIFTSDGPRRIFYYPDGTPITPGNFTATGGALRLKPDITAADGVSTATPGFNPFFGTSAAAPHAAAIAALLKSGNLYLSNEDMRTVLKTTGIDVDAPGIDRDSGAGIIMAYDALMLTGAQPSPAFLGRLPNITTQAVGGNGDTSNQARALKSQRRC